MVYPGAVHSRFEHSLGVYQLAGEAVQTLKNYQVWRTFHHLWLANLSCLVSPVSA